MNPNDFIQLLNSEHSIKELTNAFNSVSVDGRKWILNNLAENERKSLISIIRKQAVQDFWTHEQELINNGLSTREWTPDQIESIMNISEKTGKASVNGDNAYDIAGKSYYGHHMKNVAEHPEYAKKQLEIEIYDGKYDINMIKKNGKKEWIRTLKLKDACRVYGYCRISRREQKIEPELPTFYIYVGAAILIISYRKNFGNLVFDDSGRTD